MYMLLAEGFWLFGGLVVASFILTVLAEAVVMLLFKLNSFMKCVTDSLMANIGSLLLGILFFLVFNKSEFKGISQLGELFIFYFITSFFEAWIIKLLNVKTSWGRLIMASFIMNLLTFGAGYLFLVMELSF